MAVNGYCPAGSTGTLTAHVAHIPDDGARPPTVHSGLHGSTVRSDSMCCVTPPSNQSWLNVTEVSEAGMFTR